MTLTISEFIKNWSGASGSERADCQPFLLDLCEALGVSRPGRSDLSPDYCFEKGVTLIQRDGTTSNGRIDLYKAGAFVLEAKLASGQTFTDAKGVNLTPLPGLGPVNTT